MNTTHTCGTLLLATAFAAGAAIAAAPDAPPADVNPSVQRATEAWRSLGNPSPAIVSEVPREGGGGTATAGSTLDRDTSGLHAIDPALRNFADPHTGLPGVAPAPGIGGDAAPQGGEREAATADEPAPEQAGGRGVIGTVAPTGLVAPAPETHGDDRVSP